MLFGFSQSRNPSHPLFVLAGLEGAGKTCFARMILQDKVIEHVPTFRNRTDQCTWIDSKKKKHHFSFLDSGGGKVWGREWDFSNPSCMGAFFFVDGSSPRANLVEAKHELVKVFTTCQQLGIPLALMLNKSDLISFAPLLDLMRTLDIDSLGGVSDKFQVFECSVSKMLGVFEALEWMLNNNHTM